VGDAHFGSEWVMIARRDEYLHHLTEIRSEDRMLEWFVPAGTGGVQEVFLPGTAPLAMCSVPAPSPAAPLIGPVPDQPAMIPAPTGSPPLEPAVQPAAAPSPASGTPADQAVVKPTASP